jgi:hypothetical protein
LEVVDIMSVMILPNGGPCSTYFPLSSRRGAFNRACNERADMIAQKTKTKKTHRLAFRIESRNDFPPNVMSAVPPPYRADLVQG